MHYRRGGRRSFGYRDLRANRRNLRVQSALASLVHLSVHDRHPADVQPDRDGDWEGVGRRHPRALLKEGSVRNGLATRDREHDQHRRGSWSDGLLGSDAAGAAGSLLACPHSGFIIILEVFVPYITYSRILKYFALTLFSYVLAAFVIKLDWGVVFRATLIPHVEFSADYLLNIVAVFGTTISPYLFFWQASEEVEEEILKGQIQDMGVGKPDVTLQGVIEMDRDTVVGMSYSQVIMFFIIVTTAATLHAGGITTIQTASQAAEALRPLAGDLAYLLFAAGIIGTGLLAVPVLAGASAYAVAEMVGLKEGLGKKPSLAPGFYAVIAVSTLIGMSLDWLGINPITALYYSAALNGLVAPSLMALVIMIANRKDIMGQFVNSRASNVLGLLIVLIMALAGLTLIVSLATGH